MAYSPPRLEAFAYARLLNTPRGIDSLRLLFPFGHPAESLWQELVWRPITLPHWIPRVPYRNYLRPKSWFLTGLQ
jgi:hypothetical protein